jgi:hypothetical protein
MKTIFRLFFCLYAQLLRIGFGVSVFLALLPLNGFCGVTHEGQCLPFALGYCRAHRGCELIVITEPLRGDKLGAHVFVHDGTAVLDNMHPDRVTTWGNDPIKWANQLGACTRGVRLFRRIDFDHQTADDKHVIEVLQRTIP